jgi:hypothetical protein
MKTNPELNGNQLKASINGSAEQNKETLRALVEANHKLIEAAMESNKKLVDSIKEKLKAQAASGTVTEPLKIDFQKSISVSEDALDSIINAYSKQMKQNIDFNSKIIEAIRHVKSLDTEKLIGLIQENFDKSNQLTIQSTREVMSCYDRHINLVTKFNAKFAEGIKTQIDAMFDFQRMSTTGFSDLAFKLMKEHRKN